MIGWGVSTAIAVSLLIAVVLMVRRPVARAFGARAAYALWAAPLIRAVMPPLPSLAIALPQPAVLGSAKYQFVVTHGTEAAAASSWLQALLGVWLAGAAAYLALQLIRHHVFVARVLRSGRPLDIAGVDFDVVASPAVHGPLATGLVHPLILVPADFTSRFDSAQQRLALLHEQCHHRRGDIWASAAALLVTALLWFNPLVHVALGAFRRDMEAACDARVLADTGFDAAPAYAETILRCAASPVPRSLCALTAIDELKGRLVMLNTSHGPARRFAGLIVAAAVSIGGMALAIPAIAHPEGSGHQVMERKIVLRGDAADKDFTQNAGPGELERLGTHCDGDKVEIAAGGSPSSKKQQIKLFICGDKGQGAAGLADALAKAMANMDRDNPELDPKVREELRSKIDAKIRELRAKG
ncbi:MAG TPA: M56 family metallopeptidase [Sphingomicrobium sp.]|nr:M56 family metallopeptidase [Sphingomicrobium sp.]